MSDNHNYISPLSTRYASKEMQYLFSEEKRIIIHRQLWTALAESEMELGLNISQEQVDQLKANIENLNLDVAHAKEKETRHDIMAHIYAYGLQAPLAAPIIHLGATSCYVGDNTDLIVSFEAMNIVKTKILQVMKNLSAFADKYKSVPALGFTHFQPAQLVTVGKRATLWLQGFLDDFQDIIDMQAGYRLRGVKGTTGTQASFLELFDGDSEKVFELEEKVVSKMGYSKVYPVTGQTYSRKFDYKLLAILSSVAQSAYKFSNDMRILQGLKEMEEPFEKTQVGSSAMAYKRNPMRSERISALSRFVITLPLNASITASTQWFERTLDDSANKRLAVTEAFLATDAILNLMINVTESMVVYEKVVEKRLSEELPFMATEVIIMECVKAGLSRQDTHEQIRVHSMESTKQVKMEGKPNDLIDRIKADEFFAPIHSKLDGILKAENFIGLCPIQVDRFLKQDVLPILAKCEGVNVQAEINV
ncbi:MAG: adenylosuccinate lyase [Bacillota bacterium]